MPVPKHRLFYIMELSDIDELAKEIKSIDDQTRYWLMRTMGGDYYPQFYKDGFIAIGYNEITINDIKHLPNKWKVAKKMLQDMLSNRRRSLKNAGYPSSQMLRFAREMKEGDIVIMPASSSHKVSFGILKGKMYEEIENLHSAESCPFSKRRRVEWIKTCPRHKLAPSLQLMFNSRHILSEVGHYASFIDNLLNDFYTKGDNTYIVLRVKQNQNLSADDFTLVSDLMGLFNEYSEEYNLGLTSEDVKMKMRVQSEGDILAFAQSSQGIAVIGLIIMFIKGGTFSMNCGGFNMETKVPSPGETFAKIVSSVNNFLNDRRRRVTIKKLSKKLDNMEIETPSSIIAMMNELGKENNSDRAKEEN